MKNKIYELSEHVSNLESRLKTKVVHSESKSAWNIVGTALGSTYKIARIPYFIDERIPKISEHNKQMAKNHATFISFCINNAKNLSIS